MPSYAITFADGSTATVRAKDVEAAREKALKQRQERHAGEVKRSRSRLTGTTVVLLDARRGGQWAGDPADGRWITFCSEHGTVCHHETRSVAEYHMPSVDWCEECMKNINGPDDTSRGQYS